MTTCGKCGDPIEGSRIELRHVSYQGEMFSKMESSMTVHPGCRDEMAQSDRWDW